jgi:hypothetical protein
MGEDDPKVPDGKKLPAVPLAQNPFSIRFLDYNGRPMAGMKCMLDWGPQTGAKGIPGTTDAHGIVKFTVPTHAATRRLAGVIHIEAFPGAKVLDFDVIMLAQLPAGDQAQGVKPRLANLGYLMENPKGTTLSGADFADAAIRALERFRFANKIIDAKTLQSSGPTAAPFDAATKSRIEDAHDGKGPLIAP